MLWYLLGIAGLALVLLVVWLMRLDSDETKKRKNLAADSQRKLFREQLGTSPSEPIGQKPKVFGRR